MPQTHLVTGAFDPAGFEAAARLDRAPYPAICYNIRPLPPPPA